ncbi:MAG: DNA replication and repair protein RecF [Bacteroidia bacterium]|nr:DNA replication and repair protein RecF [Bacteroidia bacterium]MDW8348475.1 DNA replication and repair protein RecF [Bacteroidia bacterium]
MREGYGACRQAVRSVSVAPSVSVVRSSPTRASARDTPKNKKFFSLNYVIFVQMYIQSLALTFFRNHIQKQFEFIADINLITGLNGTGKTSILDAIHCLGLTKSYLQHLDRENITYGYDYTAVEGKFVFQTGIDTIRYAYHSKSGKKIWLNQVPVPNLSSYIGKINLLFFAPYDVYSLVESHEARKRSFDLVLSQLYPEYLHALMQYQKVLKQRNALLKQIQESKYTYTADLLVAYDTLLDQYGGVISTYRSNFFASFEPIFQDTYSKLCHQNELPCIEYISQHKPNFSKYLLAHHTRDIAAGRTLSGVHKDEIIFKINHLLAKNFASQGQQKTFVLAVKLAQYLYIAEKNLCSPILLLDDISDKLDPTRLTHLFSFLNAYIKGQIFITDTHGHRFNLLTMGKNVNIIEL